jgi:hypothetical protein
LVTQRHNQQVAAAKVAAAEEESWGGADVAAGDVAKEDRGNENNNFSESVRFFAILKPAVSEGTGNGKKLGRVLTLKHEGGVLALQCCEEKIFNGPANSLNCANLVAHLKKRHVLGAQLTHNETSYDAIILFKKAKEKCADGPDCG